MTAPRGQARLSRAELRAAHGVLLVSRTPPPALPPARGQPPSVPANPAEGPEPLLAVWSDGSVTALHGHVDLGTGLRTALAQIVAEELGVTADAVHVALGDTARAPNQGPTIASSSIQIHAEPLRRAAAQARAWLDAHSGAHGDAGGVPHGIAALAGQHVDLMLDASTPTKPAAAYRVVGQSLPRVDLPAKATGEAVFVHDVRLPGMLHGRVVRPPYAGLDVGDFVGNTLQAVDEASIAHIAGIRRVVVIRDFVGIVAEREEQAEAAMRALRVTWKPWPGMPDIGDLGAALRANPATRRVLVEQGDVEQAIGHAAHALKREYLWPYQLHASIGPSCAVAHWHADASDAAGAADQPSIALTVWTGSQNPFVLRADLARLTGLADMAIDVIRLEASGCYGRNGADDVSADAALLSRAVGAPVRVQLTREQENLWDPKGAAQLMQVTGALGTHGEFAAYDFQTAYPSNGAPTLALLLTRTIEPDALPYEMGDRTAVPPYAVPNLRVAALDMAPILRASWLRGVSAVPNSFAHESYIDELATTAGVDPVAYRLRHLDDERAAALVRATADRAGWLVHTQPQQQGADGDWLKGQGFAYARYVHSKFPGFGAAWSAWVADVEVNRVTGDVNVRRVVVGQDAGLLVNPDGVRHQLHGNVLQTTSRALKERVETDRRSGALATREWGSYPILSFREVPVVEVLLMPRPGEPPLGVGESASVPGTAAIANAIFDATGVRFREPPFTPEVVRAALQPLPEPGGAASVSAAASPPPANAVPGTAADPQRRRQGVLVLAASLGGALLATLMGLFGGAFGGRAAIAPVQPSAQTPYTAAVIERGRQLAALGNCVHCHTAEGGAPLAGGRAIETPFGTVVSTNITPDAGHGVGLWGFSAFQRAMRDGIARDGRHLYPAFPYTAFTRITDDDLQALYAWLMTQPAVAHAPPPSVLRFPFNLRPLLAVWNALALQPGTVAPDASRSALWNRGTYLVNGVGHCGACHTERGALGAERSASRYLGGALVQGWEAPALGALARPPVRWSEPQLLRYLRQGHDAAHGIAAGPMAPVVRGLAQASVDDVRAIAHYLVSLQPAPDAGADAAADALLARSREQAARLRGPAQRMLETACGACHHDGDGPQLLGLNQPLALNPNLHSARPDNLLRTILDGIQDPAFVEIGHMPAFRHALSDAQVADLAAYLRARFAPDQPAWPELEAAVARARALP